MNYYGNILENFFSSKTLPVRNMGMDMKNPPIAHILDRLDFCKYLFSLHVNTKKEIKNLFYASLFLYYRIPATPEGDPSSFTVNKN
jgi:hypothetical protein